MAHQVSLLHIGGAAAAQDKGIIMFGHKGKVVGFLLPLIKGYLNVVVFMSMSKSPQGVNKKVKCPYSSQGQKHNYKSKYQPPFISIQLDPYLFVIL
jgi:hypothetical protein